MYIGTWFYVSRTHRSHPVCQRCTSYSRMIQCKLRSHAGRNVERRFLPHEDGTHQPMRLPLKPLRSAFLTTNTSVKVRMLNGATTDWIQHHRIPPHCGSDTTGMIYAQLCRPSYPFAHPRYSEGLSNGNRTLWSAPARWRLAF